MGNMLQIAICDCNHGHCEEIRRTLQNILFDQCEYAITVFSTARELQSTIRCERFNFDLLFLEIDLDTCNGFEIAANLRGVQNPVEIVFITQNRNSVFEGYKYRALDYLIKPASATSIAQVILRYFREHRAQNAMFRFKIGKDIYQIKLSEILYFISSGRMITVCTVEGEYTYYGKLDDLEQLLPNNRFVRPHQSYIVNMEFIRCYTKDCLTLSNSTTIPISRKRMSGALKTMEHYFAY